jgi:glycosyltransferase involved in cell wall biosynthesis
MLENPLVSIIIPSYNRALLIEETLNSIITQTYTNWECMIVDDHSTDDTFLVASNMAKKDSRIKVFKRPKSKPKGPSSCRNYGFELSKGVFVNWFDSDDLMVNNKLELDLEKINSGSFDFTISQSQFFDHSSNENLGFWNNRLFSKNPINDFILKKIGWSTNAPLWRKTSLLSSGLKFDERLITSDDYLYHIKALEHGLKPIVLDRVLVNQRKHSNRLEHFKNKSPFKSIVNLYLLNNAEALKLSKDTIGFLNRQSLRLLSNLYKHKEIKKGLKFSLHLFKSSKSNIGVVRAFKLFIFGVLFYITNKGYNYLK